MKYFIIAILVLGSLTGGAGAMHFYDRYTFEQWTNIEFEVFTASRDNCLEVSKKECGMFGGFAPRDQIQKNY